MELTAQYHIKSGKLRQLSNTTGTTGLRILDNLSFLKSLASELKQLSSSVIF